MKNAGSVTDPHFYEIRKELSMRGTTGPRRPLPPAVLILADLALILLLVGGWFGARILTDRFRQAETPPETVILPTASPSPTPVPTPAPPRVTPTPTPDPRTEWQIRFADHFTDEVVITENSYSSPELSVTVNRRETGEGDEKVTFFLADIYIGRIECFRTQLEREPPTYRTGKSILELSEMGNAVLAVNGDYIACAYGGVAIRNGTIWHDIPSTVDMCILYRDGVMECLSPREYSREEAVRRGAWQCWSFGPALLNADGTPREAMWGSIPNIHITGRNPRTAIGYYEPGHYCFLVVDGRQPGYSRGARLEEMAQFFYDLGCRAAFNLDGGGSSMMTFQGKIISQYYTREPRLLSDILLVTDVLPEEETQP